MSGSTYGRLDKLDSDLELDVMRFIAIKRRPYDTGSMRIALLFMLFGLAAVLPTPAMAFDLEENLRAGHVQYQGAPQLKVAQSDGMSLSQAVESVRSRTGGRVVSAETRVTNGREVHYIKVLTDDGKVKTHKVNGRRR